LKVNDENSRIGIQDPDPDPNPDPNPDLNPDPDPLVRGMDPRIRIRIHTKMSWICNTGFNPKTWFLSSRNYDPGCSSQIPDPTDPGVKKAPDPGSATLFNRWPTQTAVMLGPPPRPLRSSPCPADRPPQLFVCWPAHTCISTPIRARIFKLLKEFNNRFQGINSASLCSLCR
jgi:hypothetical protein